MLSTPEFSRKIIITLRLKFANQANYQKSTLPVVVIVLYYKYFIRRSNLGGDDLISSDIIRGYNDTIILSLLIEKDSYGYEISKRIEELSNARYLIKETTLYSAFNRLEKNGYIVSYYGDETFGKRRTYYKITSAGRVYHEEKCREWELTKDVINCFTGGLKNGHNT